MVIESTSVAGLYTMLVLAEDPQQPSIEPESGPNSGGPGVRPFLGLVLFCSMFASAILTHPLYSAPQGCTSRYTLYSHPEELSIQIDGKADEAIWQTSPVETSFSFPWDSREAPTTSFRALLGRSHLYLFFSAFDDTLLDLRGSEEHLVASGDRMEVFFSLDSELSQYFCLEISPSSRLLDYKASYYRNFQTEWDFPGLRVAATESHNKYAVEVAIPLSVLLELGFPKPVPGPWIITGLFRADFVQTSAGVEENWISWCSPTTDHPDFHVPSAFGFLEISPIE